jgi:SynChlorMet cassette radical SAM/SPASM protein ScmE
MSSIQVMSSPQHLDIAITGKCNLACEYCFYADEMPSRGDLPTERWLAFFEELGRLKVMNVTLTGGEVFSRGDLFELLDSLVANRMRYSMLSNGTLISEKTVKQLELDKRRSRLDYIQISIDGSTAAVNDLSRPESFARAVQGLRRLKEAAFPVTARVTINPNNIDDLKNIAGLLLDDIGLPGFSTNETFPCGATNRTESSVMLTPRQRTQAMQTLTELNVKYKGRITAQAGPLALVHEIKKIESAISAGRSGLPGRGTLSTCGGVWNKLAILHDGTIVPCHNLSTLRLGVIGSDDFQKIWLEHPQMQSLRQRQEIPLSDLDGCRDCAFINFCTGGCPGLTLFLTGKLNVSIPRNCFRFLQDESTLQNKPLFGDGTTPGVQV